MIVGVIGSGSIGPDLAYGFLSSLAAGEGGKVYLLDIKKEALDAGVGRIEGYIGKALARGRMSQKAAEELGKLGDEAKVVDEEGKVAQGEPAALEGGG